MTASTHRSGGTFAFGLSILILFASVLSAQAQENLADPTSRRVVENLRADGECSAVEPGVFIGQLSWRTRDLRRGRHRVEVTPFRTGFDRGEYETIAVVPVTQSNLEWSEGEPGINYYWRIVTQQEDESYVSDVARFQPEVCPVDWASPEEMREIEGLDEE
jgi:hypothetical protein